MKHTLAYRLMKRIIDRGNYDAQTVKNQLAAFMAAEEITVEEYNELMGRVKEENGDGDGE